MSFKFYIVDIEAPCKKADENKEKREIKRNIKKEGKDKLKKLW